SVPLARAAGTLPPGAASYPSNSQRKVLLSPPQRPPGGEALRVVAPEVAPAPHRNSAARPLWPLRRTLKKSLGGSEVGPPRNGAQGARSRRCPDRIDSRSDTHLLSLQGRRHSRARDPNSCSGTTNRA